MPGSATVVTAYKLLVPHLMTLMGGSHLLSQLCCRDIARTWLKSSSVRGPDVSGSDSQGRLTEPELGVKDAVVF